MTTPRITIDLDKVEHNTRVLVARLARRDVEVVGVTKATLGSPGIGAAMLRGGVVGLGDSRVENLTRLSMITGPPARMLIRSPQLSRVRRAVRTATVSLNTESSVVAALDAAAAASGGTHGVILMVELGDLREGIAVDDVQAAVGVVLACRSLRLVGLGANLACQHGVVPDARNMGELSRLVDDVERERGIRLDVVSGGNSASIEWATTADDVGRTNQLRIGEAILLGTEPLHRTRIPGLHADCFALTAEVIEVTDKPARPWGTRAQTAFGEPVDRHANRSGTVRQAIVALGRQDVDLDGLTPPVGIAVLGMGSDHLVLDVGDHGVSVGDELRFGMGYSGLVRAMTSPFVRHDERRGPLADVAVPIRRPRPRPGRAGGRPPASRRATGTGALPDVAGAR